MDQAEELRNVIKKQNQRTKKPARIITVTSGKGGVGKSNIAVNLAVQFQRMGVKTIIFDADIGLANVEVMFGTIPQYSLNDLIYHDKEIEDIITDGPEGVGFISGGSGIMGLSNLTLDQISYLVKSVEKLSVIADIVIVDTGAGISDSVMEFVASSPENPKYDKNESVIHVLTNRVASFGEGKMVFDKLESVVKQFLDGSVHYIGIIPQDAMLEKAVRIQKPVSIVSPNARSSKRFEELAQYLVSGGKQDSSEQNAFRQFLTKLFNLS